MGIQYRGDVLQANSAIQLGGADAIRGMKNAIINGCMRLAQRGASFSDPVDDYTLDRWVVDQGGASSSTLSQETFTLGQTDVPGEPQFFMQLIKNGTGGANATIGQRIEGVRTFAGSTCVLSFWARVTSGTLSVTPKLIQKFGSGGSGDNTESGSARTVTTAWQRFEYTVTLDSMSGKTIGTDDHLEASLEMDNAVAFTLQLANVQLEDGNVASDFERRSGGMEELLGLRYYQRWTAPSNNYWLPMFGGSVNTTSAWVVFQPLIPMRANPAIAVSNLADIRMHNFLSITDNPTPPANLTGLVASSTNTRDALALNLQDSGGGIPANTVAGARLDVANSWLELDAEL